MMRTILVTGGGGQVGTALVEGGPIAGMAIAAPARAQLDLTDRTSIEAAIGGHVAAVINCAAFTNVDAAETHQDAVYALNADAPGHLAAACNRLGIPLVHLSTDYVFDGSKTDPYVEDDLQGPIGAYGRSKAEGERRVTQAGGPHLIVRTAWVVSPWRTNFVKTMIRLAAERDELRVVDDQRGSPTSAIDLAEAIRELVPQMLDGPGRAPEIVHAVNAGDASWFDLASHVMARLEAAGQRTPHLAPIATRDYPTPAARPANSMLSTARLTHDYGVVMRPWQPAIDDIVAHCLAAGERT
jgi:dTDP-4-dehydrorhamnose reductase